MIIFVLSHSFMFISFFSSAPTGEIKIINTRLNQINVGNLKQKCPVMTNLLQLFRLKLKLLQILCNSSRPSWSKREIITLFSVFKHSRSKINLVLKIREP